MQASALTRTRPQLRSRRLLAALSDERLASEAKRGNDIAFEVIYDRHHRGLLSLCRHMLRSREDAEDALQQTFASAFGALQRHEQTTQLKPWLYTIARNRCLTMLRARREHPDEDVEGITSREGLSEEVERRAELRTLLADLEQLPERQKTALVLSEIGVLDHRQVAEVLDCETKQVKALVFQARSALIENRRAREIPCAEIREQLATGTTGELRRGPLRRHVRGCSGCAEFRDEVRRQRGMLAILLPVIPSLGLKESALAAAGIGGGGAAGGGGLIAALGASGAAKVAAGAVAAGGVFGGVAATDPSLLARAEAVVERAAENLGVSGGPVGRPSAPPSTETRESSDRNAAKPAATDKASRDAGRERDGTPSARKPKRGVGKSDRSSARSSEGQGQGRGSESSGNEKPGKARANGPRRGGPGSNGRGPAQRTNRGNTPSRPSRGGNGRGVPRGPSRLPRIGNGRERGGRVADPLPRGGVGRGDLKSSRLRSPSNRGGSGRKG